VASTDFLLFNERIVPGPDSPLATTVADTKEIRLRHDQNAPSFRFAALHFKRPEANQIRYRLEPQETEWVDAGERTEASYTNLAPGEYTFRVIAANSDGVWNAEGASLRLVIEPPWWTRWWAYIVYALALGAAVFGIDRYQRSRIARRQREELRESELRHAKEIEAAYRQLQQTKEQLVQQEKLASLGSLTAGIAHEIKNPLNFVNNFAEVNAELAQELDEAVERGDFDEARQILADLRGNAEQITKHGKRADSIVRSMMQHARGESSERETVVVNDYVGEYVGLAWHGMRARDHGFSAEVIREFADDAGSVSVQPQEIGRVLLNLLNNAFHAVQEKAEFAGDSFVPEVRVATRRSGDSVEIRVSDNGSGIPEGLREKIFEPFFTTKATGEGTGLGLSLSHEIVTQGHGGSLTVGASNGGGAEFVVRLPAG
jgi:signal transduction histidine kinase